MTDALSEAARDEAAYDAVEAALDALDKALAGALHDAVFGLSSNVHKLVRDRLDPWGLTTSPARVEALDQSVRSALAVLNGKPAHRGTENTTLVEAAMTTWRRAERAERELAEFRQLKLF